MGQAYLQTSLVDEFRLLVGFLRQEVVKWCREHQHEGYVSMAGCDWEAIMIIEATKLRPWLLFQIDWEAILGEIIGLVSVVGFFFVIGWGLLLLFRGRSRALELLHEERMALVEKAEATPDAVEQLLAGMQRGTERDLRMGMIWIMVGLGLSLTAYLIEQSRSYWPGGLIPLFVGVAYLISVAIEFRRHREHRAGMGDVKFIRSETGEPVLPEQTGSAVSVSGVSERNTADRLEDAL